MAKRRKRKASSKQTAIQVWQQHTRRLLDQLQGQRKSVVDHLAAIDLQIETVTGALGRAPTRNVAQARTTAPTQRKARGRRRGGVSEAVLKALSDGKSLSIDRLLRTTGLDRRQVYACLMNLKKAKRIKTVGRGVYCLTHGKAAALPSAQKPSRGKVRRSPADRKKKTSRRVGRGAVSDSILKSLSKVKGHTVPDIMGATGLKLLQVRAGVMNLKKAKKVVSRKRGVFHLA